MSALKETISWLFVLGGIAAGFLFLIRLPGLLFTAGSNDAPLALLALIAFCVSVLPASILAMFSRSKSGTWLLIAGILFFLGILHQESFSASKQHRDFVFELTHPMVLSGLFVIGYGAFLIITSRLGWSELRTKAKIE